jgi:DNA repair exonuclease SbcCD ATPase subunit
MIMGFSKHLSAISILAIVAGGALFLWGMASSVQAVADPETTSEVVADETAGDEATIKELKEKIQKLEEENEKYKELIEEQTGIIQELKESLKEKEDIKKENNEEQEIEKEDAIDTHEEVEEQIKEIKEKARERIEENNEEDTDEIKERVRERAEKVKQQFMEKVQELKKRVQEQKQKQKGQAENGNSNFSGQNNQGKAKENIMKGLEEHFDKLPKVAQENISVFLERGADKNTESLGLGERRAVMESFRQAYGELPETDEEMARALMIANGRFPDKKSEKSEQEAKENFVKVYNRIPNMDNPQDKGAVMTMAYGLRQQAQNRNLESEQKGLEIFKNAFGHLPENTREWNVMQAITYSGATKKEDSDKDLLPDEREKELGTDPNKADTDGDGHTDGREVMKGYDPLE